MNESSYCSSFSFVFGVSVLDLGHSNGCGVVYHCSLICLPWCPMFIFHLCIFFAERSVKALAVGSVLVPNYTFYFRTAVDS